MNRKKRIFRNLAAAGLMSLLTLTSAFSASAAKNTVTVSAPVIETEDTVTVKCPPIETEDTVTVKCPPIEVVPLRRIDFLFPEIEATVGNVFRQKVFFSPSDTTSKKRVTWSSSNSAVVSVTSSGQLTARKAGTAWITTRCDGKSARCKITVKDIPLKSLCLSQTSASLTAGQTKQLTVRFYPTNTTVSRNVTWTSSNTAVATVKNGKITAKKAGSGSSSGKPSGDGIIIETITPGGSYRDVSQAYTLLNQFRTGKNVWQWNTDNRSKTWFNTNSSNRLSALKRSSALEAVARTRARELATRFSHTRPNGSDCFTAYPRLRSVGENIAAGTSSAYTVTELLKETNEYYGKQGHRRNMLSRNFNAVGIACYYCNGNYYWVQCFGWV